MEEFLLVKWREGHVAIIDIIDVVVKLRNEECNILQVIFVGRWVTMTRNMTTDTVPKQTLSNYIGIFILSWD